MTRPEVGGPSASASASTYHRMDQVSATTHRFHSTHPRSSTQPQSLGSERWDLTAVKTMHSAALDGVGAAPSTAGGTPATGTDCEYLA